jgi:hypothetical protein
LIGILMNIGMSCLFGWVTAWFCDDDALIPQLMAPTHNSTSGTSNLVAQHEYKCAVLSLSCSTVFFLGVFLSYSHAVRACVAVRLASTT